MANLQAYKVVSSLPGTLAADAIYAVRVGSGFDLYITDSTGLIAHKANGAAAMTWDYLATNWTAAPAQLGTATVSGQAGAVFSYTLSGTTRYRFVPDTYSAALDGFYSAYAGGVLSGLIVSRG